MISKVIGSIVVASLLIGVAKLSKYVVEVSKDANKCREKIDKKQKEIDAKYNR